MNTIREQLEETIKDSISWSADDIENIKESAKECEAIVEDIALKFFSWANSKSNFEWNQTYRFKSDEQIFQIFKEENKL